MTHSSPTLQKELALKQQGYQFIAGLDEAGRGAWAGPVVAAAVILPLEPQVLAKCLPGLTDSKKVSPAKRETLFGLIRETALAIGVGLASAEMVDQINVLEATRYAMQQALERLEVVPDFLLLDHVKLPQITLPQDAFPKADSLSLTVAAASIIAKVSRDQIMVEWAEQYPAYDFARHKGYGTQRHQAALRQHGACPLHRRSYKPVIALG